MKKIVCFSHGHLGDCILVLPFVNYIQKFLSQDIVFKNNYHTKKIFKNYNFLVRPIDSLCDKNLDIYTKEDVIYINLWFGICGRDTYVPEDCRDDFSKLIFCLLNNSLKKYNSEIKKEYLEDEHSFFLQDYISKLKNQTFHNSILVYNQDTYSGQGCNIDYNYIINYLLQNTDLRILTTRKSTVDNPRVLWLENSSEELDLADVAAFSYDCNYFIGPLNATVISSWTKQNLLNENKFYIIESNCDHRTYNLKQKCSFEYITSMNELIGVINDKFVQHR